MFVRKEKNEKKRKSNREIFPSFFNEQDRWHVVVVILRRNRKRRKKEKDEAPFCFLLPSRFFPLGFFFFSSL
jgi:Ribonuclease G/E